MLKRIFCKHRLVYFHRNEYLTLLTHDWLKEYHYVCNKCGKTKKLREEVIDYYYKKHSKRVAKEEAMGIDNSKYNGYEFVLGASVYGGKLGYYMGITFKKYKQDMPIPTHNI